MFDEIFRMPSPEERLKAAKARHAQIEAVMPHLKEAQVAMREAAALGNSALLSKAIRAIAVLIEELEIILMQSAM